MKSLLAVCAACGIFAAVGIYWFWPSHRDVRACREAVLASLVSPATAKFSGGSVMDSGAAKTYVLSWLSKSTSNMEMVKNEVSVSADSSSPEMMDLHIKALGLMGPARSDFEDASKASSLYFSEPFRIASTSVDSQNRAGAIIRSSAICAIRKDGSVAILSFR